MRKFSTPAVFGSRGKLDHYLIGDMGEFVALAEKATVSGYPRCIASNGAKWLGGMSPVEAIAAAHNGHVPSAEASDKFLREIEDVLHPPTAAHAIIDDVTGAVPNVGAFLAGQPMSMRRRVRREREAAPLAIIIDGTSAAGIKPEAMARRGAAIVALVRAVSNFRPVELYFGTAQTNIGGPQNGNATFTFFRVDTAPIDLARAAFFMGHPSATRGLSYSVLADQFELINGSLFDAGKLARMAAVGLPHVEQVMVVPGMMYDADPAATDPVEWIKSRIAVAQDGELEDAA